METKANFLLIGLFTLVGLLGSLVFLLWLAKVEVDRQFAYYDILFDNVSGLSDAGDVRFNGLPVGQVIDLALDQEAPDKVRVRIEVSTDTPIKTDTVAILQGLGVTGVSFVSLTGGSADAAPLPQNSVIRSEPSAWQSVLEGAPALLQKAVSLLDDINDVVNEDNKQAIGEVLSNLASASGRLDRTLADFETLSGDLSTAAQEVAGFTGRLEALADAAEVTLGAANDTFEVAQGAISQGASTLETASATMVRAQTTLGRFEATLGAIDGAMTSAQLSLANFDRTLASIDGAASSAQNLLEGDISTFVRQGTATAAAFDDGLAVLVPEVQTTLGTARDTMDTAKATFAAANTILTEDIGTIVSDLRGAVQVFTTTMQGASANIDVISDEVLGASKAIAGFASALESIVVGNERQLTNFVRLGLPEFVRLTEEARQLVGNLDRFVDRVERDPARFFLGTQGSEFRR